MDPARAIDGDNFGRTSLDVNEHANQVWLLIEVDSGLQDVSPWQARSPAAQARRARRE
jgi:hypothetical protein